MTDQPSLGPIDHARTAQQARQAAPGAEQLLNLANRAEKGLTPDEAARLRSGLTHHCARADQAERIARSAARDAADALTHQLVAEAAIERVRALADRLCREPHPSHDHECPDDVREYIRAALDPQEPQT